MVGVSLAQNGNDVLDALSTPSRERLQPHLELVRLTKGRQLLEAGDPIRHAFFPVNGFISLLGLTESGGSVEIAAVGTDGFTGSQLVLTAVESAHRLVVPVSGSAYRLSAEMIRREAQRDPQFQQLALQCVEQLLVRITQSSICLTFHTLLQRTSSWLLTCGEHARSATIELTHDFIAQMLGVSRPRVSEALMTLESRRLLHQGLGRIHLIDRHGLEEIACECYQSSHQSAAELSRRNHR